MEMPSGFTGDLMVALWADSFLSEPQPDELIVSNLRVPHLKSRSFFKVGLPFCIVRVGGRFDFDVTFDGHVCGLEESNGVRFTAAIHIGSLQDVISITHSGEIFPVTPGEALARMATLHPTSEFAEDPIVHIAENLFTARGAVEQRPTTNHRVKYCNQLLYRSVKIFLDSGFGFGKEGSDILSGGFDEEFIVVFPNMAAQKIKALVDVGDPRFAL